MVENKFSKMVLSNHRSFLE